MSSAGPSPRAIADAGRSDASVSGIKIVDVTESVARTLADSARPNLFSNIFSELPQGEALIGRGDLLDIMIWEAPPAALFGVGNTGIGFGNSALAPEGRLTTQSALAGQTVDANGKVRIPFVGLVQAANRTPGQIADEITARLQGKAHLPQVLVRVSDNTTSNVTVIGEVVRSLRLPLTAKRERLLDAIAAAGGSKQSVGKTTIQITRADTVESLPLMTVISDPKQNIPLQPNDVVTALYQPFSFTALGAIGKNAEIDFEGTGLVLSQALGRIGGLDDSRADARSVFVFRFEDRTVLPMGPSEPGQQATDTRVPVIYRINLRKADSLFLAQTFPIRNKDVIYVSNAPLADLQKFVNIVGSLALPLISVQNAVQ